MLAFPFPYIATTAGWMTAELGRQPWLVYGLMRTSQGASPLVSLRNRALHLDWVYRVVLCPRAVVPVSDWDEKLRTVRSRSSATVGKPCRVGRRRCALIELWFAIAALMMTAYVVLDGFDLGAGACRTWNVARTDQERRQVLAAIGPYWDGNEVWLLATGGALFVAFPPVLRQGSRDSTSRFFSVLWSLILRGISISEFRSHIEHPLWRAAWDAAFFAGSAVLPVLFGAALGNLLRWPSDRRARQFCTCVVYRLQRETTRRHSRLVHDPCRCVRSAGDCRSRCHVPGVED